jgi:RimJ/RimL family protein N-acetyltransferase
MEIETKRLLLRNWKVEDLEYFYALNSDPVVMEYFPKTLDRRESDELANKAKSLIDKNGWGFWVCELKDGSEFMGFVGLNSPDYELPFSPCIEVGWRFAKKYWGHGYATEAGEASLKYAFTQLNVEEVVSFAVANNRKSIAVMERLGMSNMHSNFSHPKLPRNSPLSEHVLYKIRKENWLSHNA